MYKINADKQRFDGVKIMITSDSKGLYNSETIAIIGFIMNEKPRNEKSGKFLPEGKESQMIRLDKDVADLGRKEIQTRVRQGELLEKMSDALFAIMNHLWSDDFEADSKEVDIDVDALYNFFETFREEDLEED